MMTQYAFFFDQNRCYACAACSVACKSWNNIGPGPEKWMTVYEWEEGSFPETRIKKLAFPCAHCEKPACIAACKNHAIEKEDSYGAVLVDQSLCDGCRSCYDACPYGSPKFADDEPGTKMSKCTMCIDRLEDGMMPLCVMACPLRAFDFGPLDEMKEKYGNLRQVEGMPDPTVTEPAFFVVPLKPKKKLVSFDVDRAIELSAQRGDFESLYEDSSDVKNASDKLVCRGGLRMKHDSMAAMMEATRNDLG